jgi:hypothetical protein
MAWADIKISRREGLVVAANSAPNHDERDLDTTIRCVE